MMKKILAAAVAACFGRISRDAVSPERRKLARAMTHDNYSSFLGRMPAGFPGTVNRTHPASIEPALIDAAAPPTAFGQFVLLGAANAGVRPFTVGDASDSVVATPWGATVRPYPFQQTSGGMSSSFGAATPPVTGEIDVLRAGYMNVQLNDIAATPAKGDPIYIWCAATSGIHIQGGIEVALSAGNTVELDTKRYTFNGPPDANGATEVCINV